jgi:hypothetical protein
MLGHRRRLRIGEQRGDARQVLVEGAAPLAPGQMGADAGSATPTQVLLAVPG